MGEPNVVVSIPWRGKCKGKPITLNANGHICSFPSPGGESVKERWKKAQEILKAEVSIPWRGKCKGKFNTYRNGDAIGWHTQFPSPSGESVKERLILLDEGFRNTSFPSPSGESVKERNKTSDKLVKQQKVSIPFRGKCKGKIEVLTHNMHIEDWFPSPSGEKVKERVRLRSLTGTGLQRTNRRNPLDRNKFPSENNFS